MNLIELMKTSGKDAGRLLVDNQWGRIADADPSEITSGWLSLLLLVALSAASGKWISRCTLRTFQISKRNHKEESIEITAGSINWFDKLETETG